jgi:hypothetical protein
MDTNIETTLISDLGCATAIVCEKILPLGMQKDDNSSKLYFVFEATDDLEDIINSYWIGKHKSLSREFHENLKMLKNRIYTYQDNG